MPMHTLMFGWEYPPMLCGGLGVACQNIVRGLVSNGVRVTLVLPHGDAEEEGVDVRNSEAFGETIINVPTVLQPYDNAATFHARLSPKTGATHSLYGGDLASAVEEFTEHAVERTRDVQPDVIHAHDWMTYGAGMRASQKHRVPLVAHVHATEFDRTDFHPSAWIADHEQRGLRAADHVIAVSSYTRDLLVREYGIPSEKISVVHNAISKQMRQETIPGEHGRHPLVLFLGRLTVQKGAYQFLDAARIVSTHRPDVQFIVAGKGDQLRFLIQRACALQLADRVAFAGHVRSEEAMTLYRQAGCFVMPSASEPFGLVALEAIANGAPVILSRQSGAAEVVSNGFTVDFWDTQKMADCILTVLRERPLRNQMRSETPRILSKLTCHSQARHILSVYQGLTSHA